ncbi:MAG: fused MFS/spermidine synthase, partial [Actinomycetota bacterium]
VWGVVFSLRRGTRERPSPGYGIAAVAVLALALGSSGPCEFESAYACGKVVTDPDDPSLRFLHLDTLRHGAVDLDDPTHLEFRYINIIGDVIDAMPDGPIDALHVGGGAFSVPAYINAVRPGSTNLVSEIDPLLVDVGRDELGLVTGPDLEIVTGDARLTVAELPTDAYDVIVGDVFAGLTVPWHLTTTEFVAELDRVLRPGGIYVMNVIDGDENRFVEAQLATLAVHFEHLAVVVPADFPSSRPANQILIASDEPIPTPDVDIEHGVLVDDVVEFIGDAPVLRDDFAPVEQLASNL